MRIGVWRILFAVAGVAIIALGSRHPGGTMAEMLAHPDWIPSHVGMLVAFVSLLAGLLVYGRAIALPDRTRRWLRFAAFGTAVQAIEMAVHTAAVVDLDELLAGRATPVLTTHLALSAVAYPVFGVTIAGWILAGARDRVLGSVWIAWLGVVGALGWGAATPLVVVFDVDGAGILFPMVILLALWLILAAAWPAGGPRYWMATQPHGKR